MPVLQRHISHRQHAGGPHSDLYLEVRRDVRGRPWIPLPRPLHRRPRPQARQVGADARLPPVIAAPG